MAEIVRHPLGLHLNQRHTAYVADCGLGYSAIKDCAKNPVEYWWDSPFNPLRPAEATKPAFARGEAAHVHFLDGPRTYDKVYGIAPSKATHPNHADSQDELRALCGRYTLPLGGTKPELVARLRTAGVKEPLMATAWEAFAASGKKAIPIQEDAVIRMLYRMAVRTLTELRLSKTEGLTIRQALRGGLHEVGIFWEDAQGIRQRARFDKLKPNISIDLKTITDWRKGDFKADLLREVILRGYVIQWVHYDEARRELRKAVDEGRVFGGSKEQRRRLGLIAESEHWAWAWIFAKMDGAPQVRAIVPHMVDDNGLVLDAYTRAVETRNKALGLFQFYRDRFGLENQWFDTEVVWEPEHTDWPDWLASSD